MPTACTPRALADLLEQPLRYPNQLNIKVDDPSLAEIDRLAKMLGTSKGTVARRLLHLGLIQLLDEQETSAHQG